MNCQVRTIGSITMTITSTRKPSTATDSLRMNRQPYNIQARKCLYLTAIHKGYFGKRQIPKRMFGKSMEQALSLAPSLSSSSSSTLSASNCSKSSRRSSRSSIRASLTNYFNALTSMVAFIIDTLYFELRGTFREFLVRFDDLNRMSPLSSAATRAFW